MSIDAATVARLAHIPDAEVLQDIRDTEAEIADMRARAPHLRALGEAGDRMACMRADAYVSGIREREEFIAKLRALLDARQTNSASNGSADKGERDAT